MPDVSVTITFDRDTQGARIADALGLTGTPAEQLAGYKQWLIAQTRNAVRTHEVQQAGITEDDSHQEWEAT